MFHHITTNQCPRPSQASCREDRHTTAVKSASHTHTYRKCNVNVWKVQAPPLMNAQLECSIGSKHAIDKAMVSKSDPLTANFHSVNWFFFSSNIYILQYFSPVTSIQLRRNKIPKSPNILPQEKNRRYMLVGGVSLRTVRAISTGQKLWARVGDVTPGNNMYVQLALFIEEKPNYRTIDHLRC